MDNIISAAEKAKKGKRNHRGVRDYEKHKDEYHQNVYQMLKDKSYHVSKYEVIEKVTDAGKVREIHKLPFYPDRIIQHSLLVPMMDRWTKSLTLDSYNCLPKRGITSKVKKHSLVRKMKRTLLEMDKNGKIYVLKMDIKKFYPSVRHSVYKKAYSKDLKDRDALWLMNTLNYSNKGLAIGNPDAQIGSHLVLRSLDHVIKEQFKVKHYFRFADDMVILSHDKKQLHEWLWRIRNYLWYEKKLEMKKNYRIFPVSEGIDFGGFVFTPGHTKIRKRIKKNFASKRNNPKSITSYMGMLMHCDSKNLINKVLVNNNSHMTKISDLNIRVSRKFDGKDIKIDKLVNEHIDILDFDVRPSTKKDNSTWVRMQILFKGEKCFVKGGYETLGAFLSQVDKSLLPLEDVVIKFNRGYYFDGTLDI